MNLIKLSFSLVLLWFQCHLLPDNLLCAQTLTGIVLNQRNEPLAGANIRWLNTNTGTASGPDGSFSLSAGNIYDKRIVVSYIGFKQDTITIKSPGFLTVILQEEAQLSEVQVTDKKPDNYISTMDPVKTEILTGKELLKGACCDLAGCFNTSASVQPTVTNIITNAQELRVLGLSGIYNQVLIDGLPIINALSYTYGISSHPGPFVENIYISKGANSVLQGYESISGQINVILKEPEKCDKLFLNAYMNSFSEKQFNAVYTEQQGKWNKLAGAHVALPGARIDRNDDKFLDLPLLSRYLLFNKFKYRDEDSTGFSSRTGLRYLYEKRSGGEVNYFMDRDTGSADIYGQSAEYWQPEIFTKTGYRFNTDKGIYLLASVYSHNQVAWFGTTKYTGEQYSAYGNLQYETKWMEKNIFKTGFSFRLLSLDEMISFTGSPLNKSYGRRFLKEEYIPGIFAESTLRWPGDDFTFISGIRMDRHNDFGMNITPRALLKYDFSGNTNLRFSAGRGWRTANIFSENINLLASQRDIVFTGTLRPEDAVNYGTNFTHRFEKAWYEGTLSVDFYRTVFQNQIFPDYDTDPQKAYIGNFSGTSVSNGFQSEITIGLLEDIWFKAAYNYIDVYRMKDTVKEPLPFNSKHKFLTTFSYRAFDEEWQFDANLHWYGKQRLPNTSLSPAEFRQPEFSDPYHVINVQVTRFLKEFEFYLGCENIFDFRQERPIISWQDPFGPYFDTSFNWGPTRGREFYLGVRYRVKGG
ncbi:MAG: carboxypeptidase-like regulatory domain-containing protein [Bacteroidetes bacterium]|nr:carboxypeptidase-like regulatory domain-containing protein [Bacteroidota bacterium]